MIVIGFDASARCDPHTAWKRLLGDMVGRFMSPEDTDLEIYKDENGKPHARGAVFSVSHSRTLIMCALFVPGPTVNGIPVITSGEQVELTDSTQFFVLECDKCADLGADTEYISPRRDESRLEAISGRYFNPEEISIVKEGGRNAFYRMWTEKESYLKLSGVGLKAIRTANTLSLPEGISVLSFGVSCRGEDFSCSVCFHTR